MKLLGLIQNFITNNMKVTDIVYHIQGRRNVPFSEHV